MCYDCIHLIQEICISLWAYLDMGRKFFVVDVSIGLLVSCVGQSCVQNFCTTFWSDFKNKVTNGFPEVLL